MSKQQNTKVASGGGGLLFTIAVILLVAGWAIEDSGYDVELGSLLFTIGFWLIMIPLIIFAIIIAVILLAFLASSR